MNREREQLRDLPGKWEIVAIELRNQGEPERAEEVLACANELEALLAAAPVEPRDLSDVAGNLSYALKNTPMLEWHALIVNHLNALLAQPAPPSGACSHRKQIDKTTDKWVQCELEVGHTGEHYSADTTSFPVTWGEPAPAPARDRLDAPKVEPSEGEWDRMHSPAYPAPAATPVEPCKCGHARSEHWHHLGLTPPYERKADTVCHAMMGNTVCFCEKYEAAATGREALEASDNAKELAVQIHLKLTASSQSKHFGWLVTALTAAEQRAREKAVEHEPKLICSDGPIAQNEDGSYTIATVGCTCGWTGVTGTWKEHLLAALATPSGAARGGTDK